MKEKYLDLNMKPETLERIRVMNDVLEKIAARGYTFSVRQLYYQLVKDNLVENTKTMYDRVIDWTTKGRNAGLIDWNHIEDRTRGLYTPPNWTGPRSATFQMSKWFRYNMWHRQENVLFVLCEKDALSGVLGPVCNKYLVPYAANKGYSSVSMLKDFGDRIAFAMEDTDWKIPKILYFGDHDPSGLDMDDDIINRVERYSRYYRGDFHFDRAALLMSQIEELHLPPNPAKETDSRSFKYIEKYGNISWELDALDPAQLEKLVTDWIEGMIDWDKWNEDLEREKEHKERLKVIAGLESDDDGL